MKSLHDNKFPNESEEFRAGRNELLEAERDLRRQTEKVAQMRRELPLGGKLKEDYVFMSAEGKQTKLSELFEKGKNTLVLYSMMYDPTWEDPCMMCNGIVGALNGNAREITQKVNIAVIGKAPHTKLGMYAEKTGWKHIQLLSSLDNSYNEDYFGEQNGEQDANINVFVKKDGEIYHTYGSELKFIPSDPGQDHRMLDILFPVFNILDLTPEGRGNFYPQVRQEVTHDLPQE